MELLFNVHKCNIFYIWVLFSINHNIPINSLTFHCAYLSLLAVQCRYMFRLMEPFSGDTLTNLILLNYALYMDPSIVLITVWDSTSNESRRSSVRWNKDSKSISRITVKLWKGVTGDTTCCSTTNRRNVCLILIVFKLRVGINHKDIQNMTLYML
jgi:hypothetical protein